MLFKNEYSPNLQMPHDGCFENAKTADKAVFYCLNETKIVNTDCLKLLSTMGDDSVDLIATDPPYYKVKSDEWDRQWATKVDFFDWLEQVLIECNRVLKPTGSIYLFCGPYLAAETELLMDKHFRMLNHIVWRKPTGRFLGCNKESLRKYFPQTERLMFAESRKPKPFVYDDICGYLVAAIEEAGVSRNDVNRATGTQMAGHWFGRSQFSLIPEKHYATLAGLGVALKPYWQLREDFVTLRREGRGNGRYFAVDKTVPYTDVWDFKPVHPYPGKHPCEKPLALMDHIIQSASQPGDMVFDAFVGSASTAISARRLERRFIGSEMGAQEYAMAVARLKSESLKE